MAYAMTSRGTRVISGGAFNTRGVLSGRELSRSQAVSFCSARASVLLFGNSRKKKRIRTPGLQSQGPERAQNHRARHSTKHPSFQLAMCYEVPTDTCQASLFFFFLPTSYHIRVVFDALLLFRGSLVLVAVVIVLD